MIEAIRQPGSTLTASQIAKVRSQAEEFEGVFLNTLTKTMFESVKNDSGFGGGFGEETWRSMQSEQLAASMAQNGGLGIADQLMGDLLLLQEAANTQNKLTSTTGAAIR